MESKLAVQEERIRRIVKAMGPNLEPFLEGYAGTVMLVVKFNQFQIPVTPLIASTAEVLKKMGDDDVRVFISLRSNGRI